MHVTRKTFLVNHRVQLPLIVGANVLALVSAALIYTMNTYTQSQLQTYVFALNLPPTHPFSDFLMQRQTDYARMCLLLGIVQFLFFNLAALILSHRIAGPLYRLERHLIAVGEGAEPTDVAFRKGDLYQHLADACNKVMARMRGAAPRT